MIILRNKNFSEEEELRRQIREDKKALLEKGKRKRDAAINALPYITTTSGAIVGGGIGTYTYQKALEKYIEKYNPLKGYNIENLVLSPHTVARAKAMDDINDIINGRSYKKFDKVLKIGTSKPVTYGVPLVSAGIGAIIGKKLGDKKVQDIKESLSKGKGKKKDDSTKK